MCLQSKSHPDDPVRAVPPPNTVETLQETNEAVQQDPVPAVTRSSTRSLPVNVPVSLPIRHPTSPSGRQQEEASSPELERVNQTGEAEEVTDVCILHTQCGKLFKCYGKKDSNVPTAPLPEVLRATRADVLVQVVPLVLLQSLVSKLDPAANKLSIRVRRTQAVAVLDLSRLVRVPETHELLLVPAWRSR